MLALALAGAGAGAWLGVLVAIVFAAWPAPQEGAVLAPRKHFGRAVALLAIPLAGVAYQLFTGGRARRLPALALLRPLTWALLVLLAAAVVTAGAMTARRARRARASVRAGVVATLVVIAQVLHAMDHRVLPRLYEYLHAGLGVGTALAFAAALYVGVPGALSRRAARALCATALIAAPCALALLGRWDNVRAEVFGVHAPFVRHAVLAVETLRPAAARRHRARASETQAAFDPAGLPAHPGASVLLITVDALRDDRLRPDLAPNLSAIAGEGMRLRRTYTQAPHSSYSITSLHTSEYLHETVPLGQPQPLATLADQLGGAGYYTAAFYTNGIFFTEGERLTVYRDHALGFRRADHVDRRANAQAEAAMREIDDVIRRGEPPTFLWVHFFDAHEPYGGRGATADARYDDAVRHVDSAAGRLVAYAREHLTRALVVAVTADHGEEFGEHGGVYHGSSVYEEQVRVPLVLVGPGIPRGAVDAPAQLVDLAPTLLGLVGVARATSMRGDDLRPWLVGRATAPRRAFSAVNTRAMVTDGRDKLVVDRRYGVRELYDLARDPRESRNLATSEPARTERLDAALDAWSDAVGERAAGRAVLARGRMGDRSAVPDLLALARDTRGSVAHRREAMALLAGYDDPALTAPLRPLLADGAREIADAAATALGRTGHSEARAQLLDAVARDEP
ncbi:MAG: sulfatase-like hydrolase/transferase, partial [Deltaproteobacteria bacterium]